MLKFLKIFYEHFIICLSSPLSLFPHHSSTILFLTLVLLQFVVDIAIISMIYPNYHKKIITTYNKYFHYDFPFRFFLLPFRRKNNSIKFFFSGYSFLSIKLFNENSLSNSNWSKKKIAKNIQIRIMKKTFLYMSSIELFGWFLWIRQIHHFVSSSLDNE